MSIKKVRIFLGVIVGLFSLVPAYLFLELTPLYIAWCIMWSCMFAFLASNLNLLYKGWIFLSSSLAFGLLGLAYAKAVETPYLWAIEYLSQVMILVGSGVGSTFIATHFLNQNK